MSELIWANALVVTAGAVVHGAVRSVDGWIVAFDEGRRVPARAVDCGGDFLIPGAVELHTDVLERHLAPRPGADALRAAQAAGALGAEHFLHIRCEVSTEWVVRDFEPFAGDPLVKLVSLMDHTPGSVSS
jgi:alpha-D-ribose 1-methylphosphonate 5-triphosphate diphosphatase